MSNNLAFWFYPATACICIWKRQLPCVPCHSQRCARQLINPWIRWPPYLYNVPEHGGTGYLYSSGKTSKTTVTGLLFNHQIIQFQERIRKEWACLHGGLQVNGVTWVLDLSASPYLNVAGQTWKIQSSSKLQQLWKSDKQKSIVQISVVTFSNVRPSWGSC